MRSKSALVLAVLAAISIGGSPSVMGATESASGSYVAIGLGKSSDYIGQPIIDEQHQIPKAVTDLLEITDSDGYIQKGQLALVKSGKQWGVVGTDGKVILEPQFKDIQTAIAADGTYFVRRKKELEHISSDGTTISTGSEAQSDFSNDRAIREKLVRDALDTNKPKDKVTYASDSYSAYQEKKLWGYHDSEGHVVIAPQFKEVYTPFSEDRAFVKSDDGKTVAIDGTGKTVFEAPSKDIDPYRNGLAEYRRHISKFNLGGLLGIALGVGLANHGGYYYGGNAWNPTYDGIKRGYIDRDGTIIIDSKNDAVWPMGESGTLVKNSGKLGYMNRQGQYVIQPGNYDQGEADTINNLLALKNKDTEKYGVFNMHTGAQVVPFKYESISFISPTHMSVINGEKRELIDMTNGRTVFSAPKDVSINVFFGNYTWAHKEKSDYQIIDKSGNTIFKDSKGLIEQAKPVTHGYAAAKSKGKWGIINMQGQWIVEPIYDDAKVL